MTGEEKQTWLFSVARTIGSGLPPIDHTTWHTWERLLPHILSGVVPHLLAPVSHRYDDGLPTELATNFEAFLASKHAEVASLLMSHAASYLADRGDLELAERLFRRVMETAPEAVGPKGILMLVSVLRQRGQYEEAESLCSKLSAIEPEVDPMRRAPARKLSAASVSIELAHLRLHKGELDAAEQIAQQIIGDPQLRDAANEHYILAAKHVLAGVYRCRGRQAEAETIMQDVITGWLNLFGPTEPRRGFLLHTLAGIREDLGKDSEAEADYLEAVAIFNQAYGPEDPRLSIIQRDLAHLYIRQTRISEAGARATTHRRAQQLQRPTELPQALPRVPLVGRNAPCPCGSGKKFKHCCLRKGRG